MRAGPSPICVQRTKCDTAYIQDYPHRPAQKEEFVSVAVGLGYLRTYAWLTYEFARAFPPPYNRDRILS